MQIKKPPTKFVDEETRARVESYSIDGSPYSQIDIRRGDDAITLKARKERTGELITMELTKTGELYRGVETDDLRARSEIHADIQDALQLAGFTLVDKGVRQY